MDENNGSEIFDDLFEAQPTLSLWFKLCARVEELGQEVDLEEEIIPMLNERLADWDDAWRVVPPGWIDLLLDGELVPQLRITRHLDLRRRCLSLEDAELLAESHELSDIRLLNLAYNGFQDEGVVVLMGSEYIRNLTFLDLSGNSVETRGIRAIARSPFVSNLRHLDLTGNWINDKGATHLAESEHLANLKRLILRGNPIHEEGAQALASSPHLAETIKKHWRDR